MFFPDSSIQQNITSLRPSSAHKASSAMAIYETSMDIKKAQTNELFDPNNNTGHQVQVNHNFLFYQQNFNQNIYPETFLMNNSNDPLLSGLHSDFDADYIQNLPSNDLDCDYNDSSGSPIDFNFVQTSDLYPPLNEQQAPFRSRHDSYSSSVYSPGTSQLVDNSLEQTRNLDYEFSNDASMIHDENPSSVQSTSSNDKKKAKVKCMSKNAVLARANREKKKKEALNMESEIVQLKDQNKQKDLIIQDLTSKLEQSENQAKYYRALLQNTPELAVLVEHLGKKIFPAE